MGKTQAEILEDVRSRVNEATSHHWTDEELRRWINDGARDIARRTESLLAPAATINCTAGVQEYTLAADVVRVHIVQYNPGDGRSIPLDYVDLNNLMAMTGPWADTEGTPVMYALWGTAPLLKIRLYPVPTQTSTLTVYYYQLPPDLAIDGSDQGETILVPEGWWDLLATYAEYRALRKDHDARWQEAKALYDEALLDLNATAQRWADAAGVVSTGSAAVPAWLYADGGW